MKVKVMNKLNAKNKFTLADFLDFNAIRDPSFNYTGDKIAFLSNEVNGMQIYLLDLKKNNSPVRITDFKNSINYVKFSPTEDRLVFSSYEDGNEKNQIYILNLADNNIENITDNQDYIFYFGGWSNDGKFITYVSNKRNQVDFDVYILNLETRSEKMIFENKGSCLVLGFSPTDKFLVVKVKYSAFNNDLILINLETNENILVTTGSEKDIVHSVKWLKDEESFLFVSNSGGDFSSLYFYDLNERVIRKYFSDKYEIEGLSLSPQNEKIVLLLNNNGYRSAKALFLDSLKEDANLSFPKDGIIGYLDWSPDGQFLVYFINSEVKGNSLYLWSRENNQSKLLVKAKQAVPADVLVEAKPVSFRSFDDLEIPAFLYETKTALDNKKVPIVAYIHGGPEDQFRPVMNSSIQFLLNRGYSVIAPNIRGSAGYGKRFMALDDKRERVNAIKDLGYLHNFILSLPNIDQKRIFLMGGSYGGYMTLAGLAFQPQLWSGGVSLAGISNFVTFLKNTASHRRYLREAEYGSLENDSEFLQSISPLNFVENIKSPLFLVHGANDPRVPLTEAEQIYNQLKERGVRTELLVYLDEGHSIAKLKNREDAYSKIVVFLDSLV